MIELLLSVVGQRGVDALAFLLAFALTALMDSVFHDRLPHDHGREFAVNGALSKGKARRQRQMCIRDRHCTAHCFHAVRLL